MKTLYAATAVLALSLFSCERADHREKNTTTTTTTTNGRVINDRANNGITREMSGSRPPASTYYGASDTGRNAQDRDAGRLTAEDQSESEADRRISQKIRQALVRDNGLSTNAKNIKIITIDGVVTLRGPVNSAQEKGIIEDRAESVEGVDSVDNQLEIMEQSARSY